MIPVTTMPAVYKDDRQAPAIIARCAGVVDVITAIKFAVTTTYRGLCEAGVIMSLARGLRRRHSHRPFPMKGIRIDPIRRTARAEPGLTWAEFDRETQAFGLAMPGGIQSTTGIAGFICWRRFRLSLAKVRSDIVIPLIGRLVTADGSS